MSAEAQFARWWPSLIEERCPAEHARWNLVWRGSGLLLKICSSGYEGFLSPMGKETF
jgi:hypothetical protein